MPAAGRLLWTSPGCQQLSTRVPAGGGSDSCEHRQMPRKQMSTRVRAAAGCGRLRATVAIHLLAEAQYPRGCPRALAAAWCPASEATGRLRRGDSRGKCQAAARLWQLGGAVDVHADAGGALAPGSGGGSDPSAGGSRCARGYLRALAAGGGERRQRFLWTSPSCPGRSGWPRGCWQAPG